MKIRNGFVSNSSSSSFILISGRGEYNPDEIFRYMKHIRRRICKGSYRLKLPIKGGNLNFGRECKTYKTLADKLNLVAYFILSAEDVRNDWEMAHNMYSVLEGALLMAVKQRDSRRGTLHREDEYTLEVLYDYNTMHYNGQNRFKDNLDVDHQSDIEENKRMFNSVQDMYNFLFNDESAIYNGSDELYPTYEYEDGAKAYREINGEYPWTVEDDGDFEFEDSDILRVHEGEERPDEDWSFARPDSFTYYRKDYILRRRIGRAIRTAPFIRRMKKQGKWERYKEYWDEEWKSYRD